MDRMIPLQQEQVEKLPFPPGSKVYTYDDTQCPPCADSHGTVSGAFLRTGAGVSPSIDFLYKVDLSVRGETNPRSELLLGKHLRFQNGTPVHVLKSRGNGNGNANGNANENENGNGAPVADGTKKEIVEGIVLGACDIPNDDRRKYTSDTFWYSIQILGSEDEGMSEIIHEVRPGDVTYRTIPTLVQFHNAPKLEDIMSSSSGFSRPEKTIQDRTTSENEYTYPSYKNIKGEDVIDMVESEYETQTTGSSLKRDREGMNANIQRRENGVYVPLPPAPMGGMLPPPIPPSKRSGGGNSETIDDDEPSSKRQCGMADGDGGMFRPGNGNPTSITPESTKLHHQDISGRHHHHHHEPHNRIGMPDHATDAGMNPPKKKRKSKDFQLRLPPKPCEFHAIIDIPFSEKIVCGGLIGYKGCVHKELTKISKCFIAVGGDNEASQVSIYGNTAGDVEFGVREIKDRLFEILKDQDPHNLHRVMDNTEVEYFRDDKPVSKFGPGPSPGPSSNNDPLHYPSDLPSNRTLRREHSDKVPRGNLRLMLPGIDIVALKRLLGPRLRDLLRETGCKWISGEKDDDGTSYVKVYAYVVQVQEDGVYYIFDQLEREFGPLPDAFILQNRS